MKNIILRNVTEGEGNHINQYIHRFQRFCKDLKTDFLLLDFNQKKEAKKLRSEEAKQNNPAVQPLSRSAAFTLVEVLITLGIIGVVAALTIPALSQRTNDKELVSLYLKTHNVLNNAYKHAEAEKGFKLYGLSPENFKIYFKDYLKTLSNCDHDVCLADGSYFDYECDGEKCNYITVDINGKKKPNQTGKDIYKFAITQKGLISEGEDSICSGYDCGNYVLAHHKIFDGLLPGCDTYGEDGRCSRCTDGFSKNENGLCDAINIPNCKDYVGENCSFCNKGYMLTGTTCTLMTELNCKETEDGENCSVCNDKYTSNEGVCEEIDIPQCSAYTEDRCSACDGENVTADEGSSCVPKYYCTTGSLTPTSHQCYTITGISNWATVVSSCPSGMSLASQGGIQSLTAELHTHWAVWTSTTSNGKAAYVEYNNGVPINGGWFGPYEGAAAGVCVGSAKVRTNE